ncbi:MAG: hypothetical protein LKF01_03385 [Lactobacillus sp.]|jgi:hypothetical protein|nr:hypothetical protein [Lactobacillus sp.]MCH4068531.1 hypothetical protein [Lactobacillus sp.]MCI1304174.1 hypothetical protein [Lactobacillus sp.]MCI1330331.1 hypothetical protein [Lactobacillus sp.]MCI1358922.1 hypothetical protein [Lactobacillus sp.]
MTKRKNDHVWSTEWKPLRMMLCQYEGFNLANEWLTLFHVKHIVRNDDTALIDSWIVNKLAWFILNGAAGILYLVKYIWGDQGLEIFFEFISWFVTDNSKPGHYHPSKALQTSINQRNTMFKNMKLEQLTSILNLLSKDLVKRDGFKKKVTGWKPKKED